MPACALYPRCCALPLSTLGPLPLALKIFRLFFFFKFTRKERERCGLFCCFGNLVHSPSRAPTVCQDFYLERFVHCDAV